MDEEIAAEALACLRQARDRLRTRDFDAAEQLLRQAIEKDRTLSLAYELLGKLLYRDSRTDEAAALYRAWLQELPSNPIAAHMVAATNGSVTPPRASDGFVAGLFDRAAVDFDETLAALGYQAPQLLFETAAAVLGPYAVALEILDLGCGTGQCGDWFRPLARRLVGVDLSGEMLEQARRRGCYDELIREELTGYLARCERKFDVITASDVFCYLGDLTDVLSATAAALMPQGWLIFSVESLDQEGPQLRLQEHGRYAHSPGHVLSALRAAGLSTVQRSTGRLRFERGAPVMGSIVAASLDRRPGAVVPTAAIAPI